MRGSDFRVTVHPLFLLVGVLTAFTGDLLVFVCAALAALEHECAHAFVAQRYGFRLEKIVLMPYGAVLAGNLGGIPKRQEIAVCLAGPLCSGATALGFVALWWLFPETYAYTDTAAIVCYSLFLVNLLPAYPLDGGRILRLLLSPLGERRAGIVCIAISLCFAAGIFGYFVYTCFSSPAWTALAFALLLAAGSFGGARYRRLSFERKKDFSRGIEERRVALSAEKTVGDALRFLREDRYLTLLLFEGGEFCGEVSEEEYLAALSRGAYGERLKTLLAG